MRQPNKPYHDHTKGMRCCELVVSRASTAFHGDLRSGPELLYLRGKFIAKLLELLLGGGVRPGECHLLQCLVLLISSALTVSSSHLRSALA